MIRWFTLSLPLSLTFKYQPLPYSRIKYPCPLPNKKNRSTKSSTTPRRDCGRSKKNCRCWPTRRYRSMRTSPSCPPGQKYLCFDHRPSGEDWPRRRTLSRTSYPWQLNLKMPTRNSNSPQKFCWWLLRKKSKGLTIWPLESKKKKRIEWYFISELCQDQKEIENPRSSETSWLVSSISTESKGTIKVIPSKVRCRNRPIVENRM